MQLSKIALALPLLLSGASALVLPIGTAAQAVTGPPSKPEVVARQPIYAVVDSKPIFTNEV
jgi:hypothetical protein